MCKVIADSPARLPVSLQNLIVSKSIESTSFRKSVFYSMTCNSVLKLGASLTFEKSDVLVEFLRSLLAILAMR